MKIVVISAAMLRAADACLPQVDLFGRKFGERLVFDKRSALIHTAKCYAEDFDFAWALRGLVRTEKAKQTASRLCCKLYRELDWVDFIDGCTLGLLGRGYRYEAIKEAHSRCRRRNAVAFAKLLWEAA